MSLFRKKCIPSPNLERRDPRLHACLAPHNIREIVERQRHLVRQAALPLLPLSLIHISEPTRRS
eukprot:1502260-Prymnesium_polylepis.1